MAKPVPPVGGLSVGTPQSGMGFMLLAVLLVPFSDALSKSLTGVLSPFEIAFWRYVFQMAALGLVLIALRRRPVWGPWHLMVLGGLTSAATLAALIGAFVTMPIATAIAIFFVEPLILTVLAGPFLGERAGARRYVAVGVGLIGALIVIRPSWDIFGWSSLLPLIAATAFAGNAIVIRKLSPVMDAVSIQFWFAVVALIAIGGGLLALGRFELIGGMGGYDPDGPWGQLLFMGMLSAFTFFLFSEAFRRTPASTLAPFQYLEIVGATAVGYVFFGDFPDKWTWVGTAVILASGLYVFQRERKRGEIIGPATYGEAK
ncbi:MAG TPA: DMT family transporter [Pelagibacterium sp.]|uniref:DMT family transporter n=1 Tax=Pelagibacterium sp. TaxID=1967288 RepID=UPI002C51651E|nr:DMT family transporter [Pelagibacterium sp.]HWJ88356.1 DMT family transporter [Pelagibacterium sp.]